VATTSAPAASANPCDHLDSKVFDVTDIDARTDIDDAEKTRLKAEQDERRRILYECFLRGMKELQEQQQPQPQP
jgi:hypothetical protein